VLCQLGDDLAVRDAAVGSDHPDGAGVEAVFLDEDAEVPAELRKGRELRVPAIASELACSPQTVKRELEALKDEGRSEFTGPSKTVYYRLKG